MIKLTDSEWVIMKILWNNSDCSQSTISIAAINYNINWSRNTVHTLLNRLIMRESIALSVRPSVSKKLLYPQSSNTIPPLLR